MKNEIIAENYKRFFGEELNEADQVSKQGQDMDGGPIRQNDPAAEPVGSFKPDEGAKDEQPPEDKGNDETKGKDTEDLKNQIFDLLKEGETPESIIVKFFGKDDKGEDEVKKALDDLKNEGKIQDRTIWSIVATDEDEEKTGVGKDSTKDETDLTKEEETEQPAPEMQQQAGAAPAPTTPAAGPMGGQPPAMMKNYKKNDEEDNFASDEDEDFKDDEFDDFNDDEEDEKEHETSDHPTPEMDDSDEDEDGKVIDDVIDDVDDLKVLLKSIEPRLRRLREKSASAKKAVR